MEGQIAASKFINTTASHIFLTGKAGTGKTTFLKNLSKLTYKKFLVVAPTGIAALNAGGVTIHSQFLLPPVNFIPERVTPHELSESGQFVGHDLLARKHTLTSMRKQVLRSIDLLVIDEVSMLRADLLDAIDYRMKSVRGNFRQSFGGIQVLFIGDLYQLPPVIKNDTWGILSQYYKSPWFYEAKALKEAPPVYIELEEIFRQHDPAFIQILNNLRNNVATPEDIHALNRYYKSADEIHGLKEVITLTTHNFKADEINQKELANLPAPSYFFDARIENDFPEGMYPVMPRLELKVGAQIMFVRNDNDRVYFNGKLATVVDIDDEDVWVELAESHMRYKLKKERWENKKYAVDADTRELNEEVTGSFEQFPVKLAWAITVHKSQGLTFEKAIIDVGQAFADGQVYVALSRLRSLDGLVLRTRINPAVITTDKQIVAFSIENKKPDQLNDIMRFGQQDYVERLADKTFDFTDMIRELQHLQKDESEISMEEETMMPLLAGLVKSLEEEQGNTAKFRSQLVSLFKAESHQTLLERIQKGSAYYKNKLSEQVRLVLHQLEALRQRKRVKTYITRLEQVDQMLDKKLGEVVRLAPLVESVLSGDGTFSDEEIRRQHIAERQQWISEIRAQLPQPSERKRKASRKAKGPKGETTQELTLGLFRAGLTIDQIAAERSLAKSTIESHLAKAVEEQKISIFSFMTEEAVNEVNQAIVQLPEGFSSKDLFVRLESKYSYGLIRAVLGHLRVQDPSS